VVVVVLLGDVADADADADVQRSGSGVRPVVPIAALVHLDAGVDGLGRALEHRHSTVAGLLHDLALVLEDRVVENRFQSTTEFIGSNVAQLLQQRGRRDLIDEEHCEQSGANCIRHRHQRRRSPGC
jgi:hypothetical protein